MPKTHFPIPLDSALMQITLNPEIIRHPQSGQHYGLILSIAQQAAGAQYIVIEGASALRDLHRVLGTALDEYDHARKELGLDEEPAINEDE